MKKQVILALAVIVASLFQAGNALACTWEIKIVNHKTSEVRDYKPPAEGAFSTIRVKDKQNKFICVLILSKDDAPNAQRLGAKCHYPTPGVTRVTELKWMGTRSHKMGNTGSIKTLDFYGGSTGADHTHTLRLICAP
ncbi:hypothetical protein OAO01_05020 [Oligoflexia bacterium]|nr:hypothetical protein [Oligoflexia bacterium]